MRAAASLGAAVWLFGALCASRGEVEIDLKGLTFSQGSRVKFTRKQALQPARMYSVRIIARGSGTGQLGRVLGVGDLGLIYHELYANAPSPFNVTLLNRNGRLPIFANSLNASITTAFFGLPSPPRRMSEANARNRRATHERSQLPLPELTASAKLSFAVLSDGTLSVSAANIRFTIDHNGIKWEPTGSWKVTEGKIVISEVGAASAVPQVDMLSQWGGHQLVGGDFYSTSFRDLTDVGMRLQRGQTRSTLFVIQNDGPAPDSFHIGATIEADGVQVRFFDGREDITAAVEQGTYLISDLASGDSRTLKVVFSRKWWAGGYGDATVEVTGSRISDPENQDGLRFRARP